MRSIGLAALTAAAIVLAGPAHAQAPQVEKNVSTAMAMAIVQGTMEQCAKDGYKVSVTVVDKSGNVFAQVRGDGTNPHTMEFSRLKAYTARTRNQTSLEFQKLTDKPETAYLRQIPGVVVEEPDTNLVFFDIKGCGMTVAELQEKLQMKGIAVSGLGGRVRACTHLDVTAAMIEEAVSEIRGALAA